MPARATWRGELSISGLNFSVRAFTAIDNSPSIELHQYHSNCKNRISQRRFCPVHGDVHTTEIISGHPIGDERVVFLNPEDSESLSAPDNKTINVEGFIPRDHLDKVYCTSKHLYIVPEGTPAQRPFAALRTALSNLSVAGFAKVTLHGRESIVLLEPVGRVIRVTVLEYAEKVRLREDYESEVEAVHLTEAELSLTHQFVESQTLVDFDISDYRDPHVQRLSKVIELRSKEHFESVVPTLQEEEISSVNLDSQSALEAALRNAISRNGNKKANESAINPKSQDGLFPSERRTG